MALHIPHVVRRADAPAYFIGLGLCLSFALYFFWQQPPASLLLLALAVALAYLRLEVAVALLPLAFPYYMRLLSLFSPGGYPAFALAELGIFVCLGAALLRHIFQPTERQATRAWLGSLWHYGRPLLLPALLFLLGASLAVLAAPDQDISLRAYRIEILEPLLYFLLVLRYLRTRADLARAVGALILSALLVSSIAISEGLGQAKSITAFLDAAGLRVQGPTNGPNNLALLLDRAIPIVLALALLGVLRRPTDEAVVQRPWRDPLRWVCLVVTLVLVWTLYWTDSRGAEVALLAVVVFFLVCEVRSRLALLAVGGAGLLGMGLFWPSVMAFLNKQGHGDLSERFVIWKAALLMIRDHFLLGIGPGSFNVLFRPTAPNSYLLQALEGQKTHVPPATIHQPHNFILELWTSTGLLGLAALCWLLGAFAVLVRRTYRRCAALPQGGLLQRLLLGLAGCMLASVVHGLVDNLYSSPDLALVFWFLLGMLLALRNIAQQEHAALHDKANKQSAAALAA